MALSPEEVRELQKLIDLEVAARCHDDLATYAAETLGMPPAQHHRLLCDGLEQIERGELDLLLVMMPPGSAKSSYGSVVFPAWYLGRHPDRCVIAASHTAELAERFGRRVRNIIATAENERIFNRCRLSTDSTAAGRWDTSAGGEYFATGIGGAVTGRRADCLLFNTLVSTPRGVAQICDIQPGDEVLSYAEHEHRAVYRRVVAVARRKATEYWRIRTASGCVVEATGNHRFYVGGAWGTAQALAVGDVFLRALPENGAQDELRIGQEGSSDPELSPCMLTGLCNKDEQFDQGDGGRTRETATDTVAMVERVCQDAEVYDIQVDGTECFFAGGILVHNCAIIDDPVKSREDADSETIREKQWAWWRDDLMTRLKPNAAVVLIMCMTGDTPVLMADGSEKELKNVSPGDVVATYRRGKLGASKVLNATNNGADSVYGIRMKSGTIVRANARHPFLTSDRGLPTWKRVHDLRPGDSIFRVRKGSGRELSAAGMGARSLLNAVVSALRTTAKFDGLKAPDPLRATVIRGELHESNTGTVWIFRNTTQCLRSSRVVAQFAESFLRKMFAPIGVENYASIIATKVEKFVDCCATTATWLSGTLKRSLLRLLPQSTSGFTLDQIVEITSESVEDVFDIQVEDTENFIANGLVSHNTRWHEADLAGRILEDVKGTSQRVRVIEVPMEAGEHDELGRQPGELLWPEWFTPAMVEQAKREPRTWTALYQQKPRPIGGGEFKLDWLCYYARHPQATNRVLLVDPASGKFKTRGDYTSMWVLGIGPDGNEYILDGVRDRLNLTERTDKVFELVRRWKPSVVGYEEYGLQADIEHIRVEQERHQYRFRVLPLGGGMKKEDRIRRLIPSMQQGKLWMPRSMLRPCSDGHQRDVIEDLKNEMLSFPVGAHDDAIDCLARKEEPEIRKYLTIPQDSGRAAQASGAAFSAFDSQSGY